MAHTLRLSLSRHKKYRNVGQRISSERLFRIQACSLLMALWPEINSRSHVLPDTMERMLTLHFEVSEWSATRKKMFCVAERVVDNNCTMAVALRKRSYRLRYVQSERAVQVRNPFGGNLKCTTFVIWCQHHDQN